MPIGTFHCICYSRGLIDSYVLPRRELLDGLKKVGFKTNMGIDGSGFLILAMLRLGGYYLGLSLLFLSSLLAKFSICRRRRITDDC
jgi:hypothetical protein